MDNDCSGDEDDGGPCENYRTDPVHVGTGAFTSEQLVDVRVGSGEVPLEFVRHYNSRDGWPDQPGQGTRIAALWTNNYGERLWSRTHSDTGSPTGITTSFAVIHRQADGRGRRFSCPAYASSGWSCTPSDGSPDRLTWSGTQWVITFGDATVSRFDTQGRLVRRANGDDTQYVVIAYDAANRLQSATDRYGRSLTFNWSQIVGPMGATTSWRYLSSIVANGPSGTATTVATYAPWTDATLGAITYLGRAETAQGIESYDYDMRLIGGVVRPTPFLRRIRQGGSSGTIVTEVGYQYGGVDTENGRGRVSYVLAQDGHYSFRYPNDGRNTCANPSRTTMIVDRSTNPVIGSSCSNDASGDTYCDGAYAGGQAVCDDGVCRAVTCQSFRLDGTKVRLDQPVQITGNCNCGGGAQSTWDGTGSTPVRRTTMVGQDGRVTSYAYDGQRRLIARCIGDSDAVVTTTSSSCPTSGAWEAYSYDATWGGLLATRTTRSRIGAGTVTTTFTYGAGGRIATEVEQGYTRNHLGVAALTSRTTTYTYDAHGRLTRVDGPSGERTDSVYGTSGVSTGLLVATRRFYTSSSYLTTSYSNHTALGFPQTTLGENGLSTTATYDFGGLRLLSTTQLGATTTRAYSATTGLLSTVTRPTGQIAEQTYDARGRLAIVRTRDAASTTIHDETERVYDDAGRITSLVARRANGASATVTYSENQTYDSTGFLRTQQIGGRTPVTFTFDSDVTGYLERIDRGGGETTNFVNPGGSRDAFGRAPVVIRQITSSTTGTHTFTYTNASNVEVGDARPIAVTDPAGQARTYEWDDFGSLVTSSAPEWGTARFGHDASGRVQNLVHPSGKRTSYTYDPLGRVLLIDNDANNPSLVGQDYLFTYATNSSGCPTEFASFRNCAYRAGRLAEVSIEYFAGAWASIRYDYHPNGQLANELYPDGRHVAYTQDAQMRTEAMYLPTSPTDRVRYVYDSTANNGQDQGEVVGIQGERWSGSAYTNWVNWSTGVTRNGSGRITSRFIHDVPGTATVESFGLDHRRTRISVPYRTGPSTIAWAIDRDYFYDADGAFRQFKGYATGELDRRDFTDRANRVTCSTTNLSASSCPSDTTLIESFGYDGADNRLTRTTPSGTTTYTNNGNQLFKQDVPLLTYNYAGAGGARVSEYDAPARSYTYDGLNRLRTVTVDRPTTVGAYQSFQTSIVYDHLSRPIYVSVRNLTTATEVSRTQYYYDRSNRLIGEVEVPNVAAPTTYRASAYIPLDDAGPTSILTGEIRQEYSSGTLASTTYRYHTSSPEGLPLASHTFDRASSTAASTISARANWTAFGDFRTRSGTLPPWRFAGQISIPTTSVDTWSGWSVLPSRPAISTNRWRAYDPREGQFLQPEPMLIEGQDDLTVHPYGYAMLAPSDTSDPDGRNYTRCMAISRRTCQIECRNRCVDPAHAPICAEACTTIARLFCLLEDDDPPTPTREECIARHRDCLVDCNPFVGHRDGPFPFYNCINRCMEVVGCFGFPAI